MPTVYRIDSPPPSDPRPTSTGRLVKLLVGIVGVLIVAVCILGYQLVQRGDRVAKQAAKGQHANAEAQRKQDRTTTATAKSAEALRQAQWRNQAMAIREASWRWEREQRERARRQNLGQRQGAGAPGQADLAPRAEMSVAPPAYPSRIASPGGTSPQPAVQPQPPLTIPRPVPPVSGGAQDIVARVKRSVVLVLADVGGGISSGTGFVVGDGQVATCAHVIEGSRRALIVTSDGRQLWSVAGPSDLVNDVAVLHCGPGLPPPLTLGNSRLAREGDELAVTGYPVVDKFLALGYVPTSSTTFGRINAHRTRYERGIRVDELQIDASINPGNSGGPVYSVRDGTVLGLASKMLAAERGIGFASTVNALRQILGR